MLSILNRIHPLKKLSTAQTLEDYKSSIQNAIPALTYGHESCKSMKGTDGQTLLETNVSENSGYSIKSIDKRCKDLLKVVSYL